MRVIAATHQNLEERVKHGAFREDLFHRLNVIRLRLPALRERREDMPSLARFFLQKSASELGVEAKRITDAALARLMQFDFPGNVRQLENICHWLTVMAPAQLVEAKDLPPELLAGGAAARGRAPARGAGDRSAAPARAVAAAGAVAGRGGRAVAPPARGRAGRTGWPGLEQRGAQLLRAGAPEVWDTLTRQLRGAADPHRARDHARPPHRGGAEARHRPQHDHAQDPGAGAGRLSRRLRPRLGAARVCSPPPLVTPQVRGGGSLYRATTVESVSTCCRGSHR